MQSLEAARQRSFPTVENAKKFLAGVEGQIDLLSIGTAVEPAQLFARKSDHELLKDHTNNYYTEEKTARYEQDKIARIASTIEMDEQSEAILKKVNQSWIMSGETHKAEYNFCSRLILSWFLLQTLQNKLIMVPEDITMQLRKIEPGDAVFASIPEKVKNIVNENVRGFLAQHPSYGSFLMHDVLTLYLMMKQNTENVKAAIKRMGFSLGVEKTTQYYLLGVLCPNPDARYTVNFINLTPELVKQFQSQIDFALSHNEISEEKIMHEHKLQEFSHSLREAKQGEKTVLCVDIDDCLWLHGMKGSRLNPYLLDLIASQQALGRRTVLITNRSEVSVFEEAIKCKMRGRPLRERATTTLLNLLNQQGFGYLLKNIYFKYTPFLQQNGDQPTLKHILNYESAHLSLIESEFKTTQWKSIHNNKKLRVLENGKCVFKTKCQLLTDLLRKRIRPQDDLSNPENNLRKAFATFVLLLEKSSDDLFPDLIATLSREYPEIAYPVIRDLYKVIFENCARQRYPEHFKHYDTVATQAHGAELMVNNYRVQGQDKLFTIRYIKASEKNMELRCVLIDDNWKYVCSKFADAGMEYVHINPRSPESACKHLFQHLMTEAERQQAQEHINTKKTFPTRCRESLFSMQGVLGVGIAAVAVGTALYRMG